MSVIKRICSFIIILLLFISIYKDLTISTPRNNDGKKTKSVQSFHTSSDYKIVKIKILQGETLLSITEQINNNELTHIDITKIMKDFKDINSNVDPHNLLADNYYYFPLYNK